MSMSADGASSRQCNSWAALAPMAGRLGHDRRKVACHASYAMTYLQFIPAAVVQ